MLALSCEEGAEANRPSAEPTASAPASVARTDDSPEATEQASPAGLGGDAGSTPEPSATDAGGDPAPTGDTTAAGPKGSASRDTDTGKKAPREQAAQQDEEARADRYTGPDPCTTERFNFASVREACETGGQPAAKALMKRIVKKAKAAGEDVKCSSCHESITSYSLRSNAVSDMRQLL